MKETYKVKTPNKIVIGDPWYFKMERSEVERLTVNFSPPTNFATRVILEEKPFEDYPEMMDRSITIICASEGMLPIFQRGQKLTVQEEVSKPIGVDTAQYLMRVNETEINVHTGADGCWGYHSEFYRDINSKKVLDAAIINIGFSEDFESMDDIRGYLNTLFSEIEQVENINTVKSEWRTDYMKSLGYNINDRIKQCLKELDLPCNQSGVDYIRDNWIEDHSEQIDTHLNGEGYKFEIDHDDVALYWKDFAKQTLGNMEIQ